MNRINNSHPQVVGGSPPNKKPTNTTPYCPPQTSTPSPTSLLTEIKKLVDYLSAVPQPQSFTPCLPQFGGRHSWNPFAVKLPQGKIYQCQFCFREKLIPPTSQQFAQYYPPQTYYIR